MKHSRSYPQVTRRWYRSVEHECPHCGRKLQQAMTLTRRTVITLHEVIRLIRAAKQPREARDSLVARFEFSEKQAQAIIEMQLQRLTGMDHLVTEFAYGGMPHEESELNMRLFADRVLPTLQRDPAYAAPKTAASADAPKRAAHGGIFAPA